MIQTMTRQAPGFLLQHGAVKEKGALGENRHARSPTQGYVQKDSGEEMGKKQEIRNALELGLGTNEIQRTFSGLKLLCKGMSENF